MNIEGNFEDLQKAFGERKFSSTDLVRYNLERIKLFDRTGPEINAVITINEKAIQIAGELDRERVSSGARGPLHGITMVLKDNFNTSDMPTTSGCKALEHCRPRYDSFLVRKLREAGAIILAKVNLHELARSGTTVGSMIGQTRNPYDLTRTPGGSSGGTAAAIAAGYAVAGMGADTVNSVRSPASAVCLVGFRPTRGLLSRAGIMPVALSQDTAGPITASVVDAAHILDAVAGYDPDDIATAWCLGNMSEKYSAFLKPGNLKGIRLGLPVDNIGSDPEVLSIVRKALRDLEDLGAEIIDISDKALGTDRIIAECDVIPFETKPNLNSYFESLGSDSPVHGIEELLASNKVHESVRKGLEEAAGLSDPLEMMEYKERLLRGAALRDKVLKLMADNGLDALVYPHQQVLVAKIGEPQLGRNGILSAVTGFPAITVPGGFSGAAGTAPMGVPVGMEFFGRPWNEALLLSIAHAYESRTRHRRPPIPDAAVLGIPNE